MQRSGTDMLIYSIPQIIAFVSDFTHLAPGDVIATGTPAGVGHRRAPAVWMKPGDVLEVEISGIGTLRNPVVDERRRASTTRRMAYHAFQVMVRLDERSSASQAYLARLMNLPGRQPAGRPAQRERRRHDRWQRSHRPIQTGLSSTASDCR